MATKRDKTGTEQMEMQFGPRPFRSHHEEDTFRVKVIKEAKEGWLHGLVG